MYKGKLFLTLNLNMKAGSYGDVLTGTTKLMLTKENVLYLRWCNKSLRTQESEISCYSVWIHTFNSGKGLLLIFTVECLNT